MNSSLITGTILDTKRFAIHDGPGVRTAFYLKGCPLKCLWCHNPESISNKSQIGLFKDNCINCGNCVNVCPANLHKIVDNQHLFEKEKCNFCGACEEVCSTRALKIYGQQVTVQEALDIALEDIDFYQESNGGVTLSGGEPLYQSKFALYLLEELKKNNIHTALDTCLFVPLQILKKSLPFTDLYLVDFKHFDSQIHQMLTGQPNELIKENLNFLSDNKVRIEIRIPLIPTCNNSNENLHQTGEFLSKLNIESVKLLPYHSLASAKYFALDMENTLPQVNPPDNKDMEVAKDILASYNLSVL